jgi:hypothetical protein
MFLTYLYDNLNYDVLLRTSCQTQTAIFKRFILICFIEINHA